MANTIFFYDWNHGVNGTHVFPGLIYEDSYIPYIRMDLKAASEEFGDDDGETIFNDDETRDSTFVTAALLDDSSYQNKDYLTYVRARIFSDNKPAEKIDSSDYSKDEIINIKSSTGKVYYLYTTYGELIRGKQGSEVLDIQHCTSKNIYWNKSNKKFCFRYNNNNYDFYTLSGECKNGANNLVTFADDGTLLLFVPPSSTSTQFSGVLYSDHDGSKHGIVQHTNEIVGMYSEVTKVDKLNVITKTSDGKISSVYFYRCNDKVSSYWTWAKNLRKTYEPNIKDDTKSEDVLDNALQQESVNVWKTPAEFYTDWKPTQKIVKGYNGFIRAAGRIFKKHFGERVIKETMPVWFWCNTLRNWCTYKYTRRHTFELFLWNGKNGWDPATKIILPTKFRKQVLAKYLYDVDRFVRGSFIAARIHYDKMYVGWRSIKLFEDTKFSQYDDDTFQTVKLGKTYLNNKGTRRYPFSVGIPPIYRSAAGEITMLYSFTIPGMAKWIELVKREQLDFINSVCQAYFGKGDDKEIFKNWKRWTDVKDVSEETANEVITDEKSTLIYQPEINTIREDNEVLNVTLTIPRQYPETENGKSESYIEEWSR